MSLASVSSPQLSVRRIGNALVVCSGGQVSDEAHRLALAVGFDPGHDVVVVDPPSGSPIRSWEAAAAVFPRRLKGARVLLTGRSRETVWLAGQWLAYRLRQPIIVPDGDVRPCPNGSVFVESAAGGAWLRFQRGSAPERLSPRFPAPPWECEPVAHDWRVSPATIAEVLPGGMWLRPAGPRDVVDQAHRRLLVERLRTAVDELTVVIGAPGGVRLAAEDIQAFWASLAAPIQPLVRFMVFGPVAGAAPGQWLADLVGEPIVCHVGIPIGDDMYTLRPDGSLGWATLARALRYEPGGSVPVVSEHRAPWPDLVPVGDAVYWYGPDAVVEVVAAGLWVRGTRPVADEIRRLTTDPHQHTIVFEDADDRPAMQALAVDVESRLAPRLAEAGRILPASAAIALATLDADPATADQSPPAVSTPDEPVPPTAQRVRSTPPPLQPTPRGDAVVGFRAERGDRDVVRDLSARDHPDTVATAARLLATVPALGTNTATPRDVRTDTAAALLVLGASGTAIERELRAGRAGTAATIARCAMGALTTLPVHRGPAVFAARPTTEQWEFLRECPVLTEWGFLHALTAPCRDQTGTADVVVWSTSARRTVAIEPDDDHRCATRLLFLPGTRFHVLGLMSAADHPRARVLLRELEPGETGRTANPARLRSVRQALERSLRQWDAGTTTVRIGTSALPRFGQLPGFAS